MTMKYPAPVLDPDVAMGGRPRVMAFARGDRVRLNTRGVRHAMTKHATRHGTVTGATADGHRLYVLWDGRLTTEAWAWSDVDPID